MVSTVYVLLYSNISFGLLSKMVSSCKFHLTCKEKWKLTDGIIDVSYFKSCFILSSPDIQCFLAVASSMGFGLYGRCSVDLLFPSSESKVCWLIQLNVSCTSANLQN